jgi:DNA-binding NarL/FixJ family response regulator
MQTTFPTKVLVRHRDPLISAGLTSALRKHADLEAVEAAPAAVHDGRKFLADVVIADYDTALEIMTAAQRSWRPRGTVPQSVLVVTRYDTERQIRHALEMDVRGYLLMGCSPAEVADAVRALHRGDRYLDPVVAQRMAESLTCELPSRRELDVLRLLTRGHGNKAIASKLDIAIGTVKSHVRSILQKMNACSRTEAAAIADHRGLLTLDAAGETDPVGLRRNGRLHSPSAFSTHPSTYH